MTVALNAPCSCGSGKKYKRCCYLADDSRPAEKRTTVPKILAAVSLVAGVVTFLVTDDLHTSSIVAIGGCVAALALVGFTDPPPPKTGSGDPAGMNFGR